MSLDSGIEVGPTSINFYFFTGATVLLLLKREKYFFVCAMGTYSRPYVYSFCQIFKALRLFPALSVYLGV